MTYFCKPIIVLTGTEEGSNLVSNLASNNALSNVAAEKGLYKYIIKNPCQYGEVPPNTRAPTTEAIIGAVWYDSGKDVKQVQAVFSALNIIK